MRFAVDAFERLVAAARPDLPPPPPDKSAGDALPLTDRLAVNATFNGWRFLLAAGCYWLLTRSEQRKFTSADCRGGVLIGLFFASGMFVQIVGLGYTLPSISGFLTALVVVFAPLAQAFVLRERVSLQTWMAVGVAMAGIAILSAPNPEALTNQLPPRKPPVPFIGEILTIIGALFFTGQLLTLDHYGRPAPGRETAAHPTRLTLLMLLTTALFSIALGAALGGGSIYSAGVLRAAAGDWTLQWSLGTMTLFSSVLAIHLMNTWQPRISAARASVVYCLEPVFATLFSVAFRTEHLTWPTVAGGAVILAAVLLVSRPNRVMHDA